MGLILEVKELRDDELEDFRKKFEAMIDGLVVFSVFSSHSDAMITFKDRTFFSGNNQFRSAGNISNVTYKNILKEIGRRNRNKNRRKNKK